MSLNFYLEKPKCPTCGHSGTMLARTVTHNLKPMWTEAAVADALYESKGKTAAEILPVLERGLTDMVDNPERFKQHESPNGWGTYDSAVEWLRGVVEACRANPTAVVGVRK